MTVSSATQEILFDEDKGIRGIQATFTYPNDLAGSVFTFYYTNTRTGVSGTWTGIGVWTAGTCIVTHVFTDVLVHGDYKIRIEVAQGQNEFNVGEYYLKVLP